MRSHFHPILAVLTILSLVPAIRSTAETTARPNILLILSENLGGKHLGHAGDKNAVTPRLNQLAGQSIRFTRAYAASSQGAPARKSLLTGRSPTSLQQSLSALPLQHEAISFPEVLRSGLEFRTGFIGRTPNLNGDPHPWVIEIADRHDLRTNTDRVDVFESAKGGNGNAIAINGLGQFRAFLDETPSGHPFFLQLGFSDPERNWDNDYHPSPRNPAKLILPAHYPDTLPLRKDLAAYYDEIARLDHHVGKVLDELDARGLSANTIVVFTAVNGSPTLRGKGTLYESGVNIPLLVRWPGVVTPGVSHALVSGEDLAPTLLDAVDLPVPEKMTGGSFLPLLKGGPFSPRTHVFAERGAHIGLPIDSAAYDEIRTVIGDRYKLVYNTIPSLPYLPADLKNTSAWQSIAQADSKGKLSETFRRLYRSKTKPIYELYDLKADPSELVNLSEKQAFARVKKALQQALIERMVVERDHVPLPMNSIHNPED